MWILLQIRNKVFKLHFIVFDFQMQHADPQKEK